VLILALVVITAVGYAHPGRPRGVEIKIFFPRSRLDSPAADDEEHMAVFGL